MKHFVIILTVFMFLGTGCRDFLNVIPKNQKVVASIEDVKLEMYAFLSMFLHSGSFQNMDYGNVGLAYPQRNDVAIYFCMYSDDLIMSSFLGTTDTDSYRKYYFENVGWKGLMMSKGLWEDYYASIGLLNTIIQDAGKFRDENMEDYERICGEARTIRAYYFFKLLQLFAPYQNNTLGIPINTIQDDIEPKPRSTQQEVYQLVINELNAVLEMKTAMTNWNVFYDPDIAHAILAQVYWFKAGSAATEATDWANAEKYAALVLNNYEVESSIEAYQDLFSSAGIKIIKRHQNAVFKYMNRKGALSGMYTGPWGNGKTLIAVSELVNAYDPNDIRKVAYFNIADENGAVTNYINKFHFNMNKDGISDMGVLFRASDMLLIQAEALARQEKLSEAKALLVKFKQAKVPGYTDFEGDVLKEIWLERRKEFCFEGDMRWLDMKRLGVAASRLGVSPDQEELVNYELKANDYRYALPIPEDVELQKNPIMQNPGWGNVNQ